MDTTTLLGVLGAALILFAFFMNQVNKWANDSLVYDTVNFVGSGLLVAYAFLLSSWPFFVLNAIWALVSLRDMFLDMQKVKK